MDKLKWVCTHHNVSSPQELIGLAGHDSTEGHLLALGYKSLKQEEITKLNLIRDTVAKIKHTDDSETIFDRYIWLKEAKRYCDELYEQYYDSGLLGHALKNEKGFREPIGFLSIREYVLKKFNEYEDQYLKEMKNKPYWDLPDPEKIAEIFVNRVNNKSGDYNVSDITPVMSKAAKYIFEKRIFNIDRHVKPIADSCCNYAGSKNAKRNWITFYAHHSGLKVPVNEAK